MLENNKKLTLHQSGEDYLEAILVLERTKGTVRSIDVVNYLNYSKPSVSRAVSILRQAGYLTMEEDHILLLTDMGRKVAEVIYERHCFFADFLSRIGVRRETAEADACKIEHVISAESFQRLKEVLGNCSDRDEIRIPCRLETKAVTSD